MRPSSKLLLVYYYHCTCTLFKIPSWFLCCTCCCIHSRIPYLYEDAFHWYESFDPLGELLTKPNPTPVLDVMDRVLNYLVSACLWPSDRIHLFGFAQGGCVVAETALRRWQASPPAPSSGSTSLASHPLGSVVTVEGPLLSYPTIKPPCAIPVLYFHRSKLTSSSDLTSLQKGFAYVNEARCPGQEGMPRGKEEWTIMMEFWSRMLSSRTPEMGGLHPVLSGGPPVPSSTSEVIDDV